MCCDAGCDLVRFGQHLRSLLQVILHCTHSLPIKTEVFATLLGFLWVAEEKKKACGDSCSAAVEPEEERQLLHSSASENPLLSTDLSFVVFFSFTQHT